MKRRTVILLFILGGAWLVLTMNQASPPGSTLDASPGGARGFFLLLERQHLAPKTWYRPFQELPKDERDATFFLVAPTRMGAEQQLLDWVRAGNRLVLFASQKDTTDRILGVLDLKRGEGWNDFLQLVEDVSATVFSCSPKLGDPCGARGSMTAPGGGFVKPKSRIIAGTPERAVAVRMDLGKGEVWALSGSAPIQNENIEAYDNLPFLFSLAAARSAVYFDEFHHGYTEPTAAEASRQQTMVVILGGYLVAFLVLVVLTRSVRFGPARAEHYAGAFSSGDFAAVLGLLYAEHNAVEKLELYRDAWMARARRAAGSPVGFSDTELVSALVTRGFWSEAQAARVRKALSILKSPGSGDANLAIRELEGAIAK